MLQNKWPLLTLLFLIASSASASPDSRLFFGAKSCKVHIIKKALQKGADVNYHSTTDEWGQAPLHVAVKNNCYNVVYYLLTQTDANIDIFDDFDRTPIYYAAQNKNHKIFWLLLRAGANPNIADVGGKTPVDLAENNQIF